MITIYKHACNFEQIDNSAVGIILVVYKRVALRTRVFAPHGRRMRLVIIITIKTVKIKIKLGHQIATHAPRCGRKRPCIIRLHKNTHIYISVLAYFDFFPFPTRVSMLCVYDNGENDFSRGVDRNFFLIRPTINLLLLDENGDLSQFWYWPSTIISKLSMTIDLISL